MVRYKSRLKKGDVIKHGKKKYVYTGSKLKATSSDAKVTKTDTVKKYKKSKSSSSSSSEPSSSKGSIVLNKYKIEDKFVTKEVYDKYVDNLKREKREFTETTSKSTGGFKKERYNRSSGIMQEVNPETGRVVITPKEYQLSGRKVTKDDYRSYIDKIRKGEIKGKYQVTKTQPETWYKEKVKKQGQKESKHERNYLDYIQSEEGKYQSHVNKLMNEQDYYIPYNQKGKGDVSAYKQIGTGVEDSVEKMSYNIGLREKDTEKFVKKLNENYEKEIIAKEIYKDKTKKKYLDKLKENFIDNPTIAWIKQDIIRKSMGKNTINQIKEGKFPEMNLYENTIAPLTGERAEEFKKRIKELGYDISLEEAEKRAIGGAKISFITAALVGTAGIGGVTGSAAKLLNAARLYAMGSVSDKVLMDYTNPDNIIKFENKVKEFFNKKGIKIDNKNFEKYSIGQGLKNIQETGAKIKGFGEEVKPIIGVGAYPLMFGGGMIEQGMENPTSFILKQAAFANAVQGIAGYAKIGLPKLKIKEGVSSVIGKSVGDVVDIGADLPDQLRYSPKEMWPEIIVGTIIANYVLDAPFKSSTIMGNLKRGIDYQKTKSRLIKEYGAGSQQVRYFEDAWDLAYNKLKRKLPIIKDIDISKIESAKYLNKQMIKDINNILTKYDPIVIGSLIPPTQLKKLGGKPIRKWAGDMDIQNSLDSEKMIQEVYDYLKKEGVNVKKGKNDFMGKPKYHITINGAEFINAGTSYDYFSKTQLKPLLNLFERRKYTQKTPYGYNINPMRDQMRVKIQKGYVEGNRPKDIIDVEGMVDAIKGDKNLHKKELLDYFMKKGYIIIDTGKLKINPKLGKKIPKVINSFVSSINKKLSNLTKGNKQYLERLFPETKVMKGDSTIEKIKESNKEYIERVEKLNKQAKIDSKSTDAYYDIEMEQKYGKYDDKKDYNKYQKRDSKYNLNKYSSYKKDIYKKENKVPLKSFYKETSPYKQIIQYNLPSDYYTPAPYTPPYTPAPYTPIYTSPNIQPDFSQATRFRIGKRGKKKTAYQPILYDELGHQQALFPVATNNEAIETGMFATDELPINKFKIKKVHVENQKIKKGLRYNQKYKFKKTRGGYTERRYYRFDKKNERQGNFNIMPFIYG